MTLVFFRSKEVAIENRKDVPGLRACFGESMEVSNKQTCFVFVYYGSEKQIQINNTL